MNHATIESVRGLMTKVLRQLAPNTPDELTADANLLEIPGFDSTILVQMLSDVEEEFEIEFSDEDMDLETLTTFGPLCALIARCQNEETGSHD